MSPSPVAMREALVRRRRGILGAGVALAVAAIAVLTVEAWPTTTYDLEDSGVWVINDDDPGRVGRLNAQIPEIDLALQPQTELASPGRAASLLQDGRHAYLVVQTGDTTSVQSLDPADPRAEPSQVEVPGTAVVRAGGGVVAALVDGEVSLLGRDGELASTDPVIETTEDAQLVVGVDGTVAVYDAAGGDLTLLRPGAVEPDRRSIDAVEAGASETTLTLVGDDPVVLDTSSDGPRLLRPGLDPLGLDLSDDPVRLQRPGPPEGRVVVATGDSLLGVDLGGSSVEVIDDGLTGDPLRPAVADGCVYAAGSGSAGSMTVVCGDEIIRRTGLGLSDRAEVRPGGPHVVVNDRADGRVLVVVDGAIEEVTAWPDDEQQVEERDQLSDDPPNPYGKNPPETTPDVGGDRGEGVGARPGRVTYLPVLRNDRDADGDILAVHGELRTQPGDADILRVAHDGRSVRVDLSDPAVAAERAGDTIGFEYRATDGKSLSAWTEVEVEVVADDEDHEPSHVAQQRLALRVAAGRSATYDVLSAFWDYDGDPVFLEAASVGEGGHRLSWEADGQVTFHAGEPGVVSVGLTVRDIRGERAALAELEVSVEPPTTGDLGPVLRNDVSVARVGVPITIHPLLNDHDPHNQPLALAGEPEVLETPAGALSEIDVVDEGSLRFTPTEAGEVVLIYSVSGVDPEATRATVLVIVAPEDTALDPVVRPDVVVVEEGQSAEVDLLANDLEPQGGLIAVTELGLPTLTGAGAEGMVERELFHHMSAGIQSDQRTLRVDLLGSVKPDTFITYGYVGSNGPGSARSTVTVVVIPDVANRTPVTNPVRVTVRQGDAVTVPVADFATDPDGDPLEVSIPGDAAGAPSHGDIRANGDSVRYFAPAAAPAQAVTARVQVSEPGGTPQDAEITIDIVGPDADTEPRAEDLEARVRAGRTVTVPIALLGLDPDGDSVRLLGRVGVASSDVQVSEDHQNQTFVVSTTPDTRTGITTFRYVLEDSRGRQSEPATVRVLVTGPGDSEPVATIDRISAGAGQEIWIDPVENDTDLDGDPLALAPSLIREGPDEPVAVESGDCAAEVVGGRVKIATDESGGSCTVAYAVIDVVAGAEGGRSLPQEGRIVVTAVEGFPGLRPLARDDYARLGEGEEQVEVAILRNDLDRDGPNSELSVELVGDDGEPWSGDARTRYEAGSGLVVARVDEAPRMVRYRITDAGGLTADAVVRVPGAAENRAPRVRDDVEPIVVSASIDTPLVVDLDDYIFDPDEGDVVQYLAAAADKVDSGVLTSRLRRDNVLLLAPQPTQSGRVIAQVEATDGKVTVSLPIPVEIEPALNQPPEFAGDPCGPVVRGRSRTIPLRAEDPDPGDIDQLVFGVEGPAEIDGVSLRVVGGRSLEVAADEESRPGRAVTFTLVVTDPDGGEATQTCTIDVQPVDSPPLQVDTVSRTIRHDETLQVDVTELVRNAEGAVVITSVTVATVALPGGAANPPGGVGTSTVTYRPARDVSGTLALRYEVRDTFDTAGDPRRVSGLIEVTVLSRPQPPTRVTATVIDGAAQVTVSWQAQGDGGSPITEYRINGRPGGTTVCRSQSCVLGPGEGIVADGSSYSFEVVAVNAIGVSDPATSNATGPVDVAPDPPTVDGRVTSTDQEDGWDQRLEFTWSPPASGRGSEIVGYELAGAASGPVAAGVRSVEVVISPGGPACLDVVALNRTGQQSAPGRHCIARPFGRPMVTDVVLVPVDGDTPAARITWGESGNGSDIVDRQVSAPGCTASEIGPGTARLSCAERSVASVTVAVRNADGLSRSATAQGANLFARPVIELIGLTAGDRSVEVAVRVTDDGGGGVGGGRFTLSNGATGTLDGFGRGTATVPAWGEISLTSAVMCRGEVCSEPVSSSSAVLPFTNPEKPVITSVVRNTTLGLPDGTLTVTFSWQRGGSPRSHTYSVVSGSGLPAVGALSPGGDAPVITEAVLLGPHDYLTPYGVVVTVSDGQGLSTASDPFDLPPGDCDLVPAGYPGCGEPEGGRAGGPHPIVAPVPSGAAQPSSRPSSRRVLPS